MNNKKYFISFTAILFLFLTGCVKEKKTERDYPQIRTLAVDQITKEGARFNAAIVSGAAETITEYGFVWGRYDVLTIQNSEKVTMDAPPEKDQFSMNINSSLEAMKEYYVRSYVKAGELVIYGDAVKFTSLGSMAPEIIDFEPKSATWGDTITIHGKNLTYSQNSIHVYFGTVNAIILKLSAEEILIRVPDQLTAKTSTISVDILGNQSVANDSFTLLSNSSVESVSPAIAKWGDTLIIKGIFPYKTHTILLRINEISTTILNITDDKITAILPPSNYIESAEIKLGIDTHWILTGVFIQMISPNITSISPSSFGWEDTVLIKGSFYPIITSNQVLFDSKPAQILKLDKDAITCIVPFVDDHSAQLVIRSGSYEYHYAYPIDLKGPEIISITPDKAKSTELITIKGKYFYPWNTSFTFNNIDNLYNYQSSTSRQIVAYLAGNITSNGPVTVKVTVSDKSRSYSNLLEIANPRILSVSPAYSFYGDVVTISGEYFDPNDVRIYLCSENDAVIESATPSEIKFKMPDNVNCNVSSLGLIISGNLLVYSGSLHISPPVVNDINPSSGIVGDIMELTGDFFNPEIKYNKVYFTDKIYATPIDGDRYHLRVKVPSLLNGQHDLKVSTGGTWATTGVFQCNSPWTYYNQLGIWQYDQSTIVKDNKMYLIGGLSENSQYFQQYDFVNNQITTYDYPNTDISEHMNSAAFIIGDYAYFGIGNWLNIYRYTNNFYKFSLTTQTWTALNTFPGALRSNSFYFSCGGYGYIGTGFYVDGGLNDIWQYDPSNDSWSQKANFPGGSTYGATAVMHNGSAYVIDKNHIWLYDPIQDQWTKKADFPGQPRFSGVGIDDINGIYYGLGSEKLYPSWDFPKCYSDFWYYSIDSDTWNRLPDFPESRRSAYGFSYNGKIYVGGGGDLENASPVYFKDIIEFDPNF